MPQHVGLLWGISGFEAKSAFRDCASARWALVGSQEHPSDVVVLRVAETITLEVDSTTT